jgi:hypothetical protein
MQLSDVCLQEVVKVRRKRWEGLMERMGTGELHMCFGWGGNLRGKGQLEDLGVDVKIILNRSSRSGME